MLCILSPAKTMVTAGSISICSSPIVERSIPVFIEQADMLSSILKSKNKKELQGLCGVSDAISAHVKNIYVSYIPGLDAVKDFSRCNQAARMFDGPAFRGYLANDTISLHHNNPIHWLLLSNRPRCWLIVCGPGRRFAETPTHLDGFIRVRKTGRSYTRTQAVYGHKAEGI